MSSVVISGDTSGAITLQAPAVSGNTTLNLPASSGTVLTQNSSAPANSFVVDASGNVGIGQSSPTQKLDIVGNVSLNRASATSYNLGGGIKFQVDGVSYAAIAQPSAQALAFYTNNDTTERMRITSNGGISFGSSGTNFGTSGQVLQSNGDAAPTWVTPASGGVTSLNGQTGAITNTDYGAIGSYVIAAENSFTANTERLPNVTVAGSTLIRSTDIQLTTAQGLSGGAGALSNNVQTSLNTNLGLSGTWRRMTRSINSTGTLVSATNLYVRIS